MLRHREEDFGGKRKPWEANGGGTYDITNGITVTNKKIFSNVTGNLTEEAPERVGFHTLAEKKIASLNN